MEKTAHRHSLKPPTVWNCHVLSDCKPRNTIEFSVCVVTNLTITLSKVYTTRRTSDKTINLKSCFLDVLPSYSITMIYIGRKRIKSFWWICCQMCSYFCLLRKKSAPLLLERAVECTGSITNSLTKGAAINKTGAIVKIRSLAEQVILKDKRHLKIVRIIYNESFLFQIGKIFVVPKIS